MKRSEDLDVIIAELIAEHVIALKGELFDFVEKQMALKPIPPFVPPQPWIAERLHPAGLVVRHRGGIFSARRDTLDEPPSDAWLPLLVGITALGTNHHERTFALAVEMSDGCTYTTGVDLDVPIVRGNWSAETTYQPGDRVFRFGEWHCLKACVDVDPNTAPNAHEHWLRVPGKQARAVTFKLADDGTLYESGHAIGSIKPVLVEALRTVLDEREKRGAA
jgi:hypothetical protein